MIVANVRAGENKLLWELCCWEFCYCRGWFDHMFVVALLVGANLFFGAVVINWFWELFFCGSVAICGSGVIECLL